MSCHHALRLPISLTLQSRPLLILHPMQTCGTQLWQPARKAVRLCWRWSWMLWPARHHLALKPAQASLDSPVFVCVAVLSCRCRCLPAWLPMAVQRSSSAQRLNIVRMRPTAPHAPMQAARQRKSPVPPMRRMAGMPLCRQLPGGWERTPTSCAMSFAGASCSQPPSQPALRLPAVAAPAGAAWPLSAALRMGWRTMPRRIRRQMQQLRQRQRRPLHRLRSSCSSLAGAAPH